jgi:hypothetical protein
MRPHNPSIRLECIALAIALTFTSSAVQAQTRDPATPIRDGLERLTANSIRIPQGEVRHNDPLWNGALIGAGVAVASGLLLCRAMEPWENCRDDAGPMLRIGALGAGIGIAIDALIRRGKTAEAPAPGSARLHAAPVIRRHARGVQVALRF